MKTTYNTCCGSLIQMREDIRTTLDAFVRRYGDINDDAFDIDRVHCAVYHADGVAHDAFAVALRAAADAECATYGADALMADFYDSVSRAVVSKPLADLDLEALLSVLYLAEVWVDTAPRYTTFDDALNVLDPDAPIVREYEQWCGQCADPDSEVTAYLQMRIIVAAHNEEWTDPYGSPLRLKSEALAEHCNTAFPDICNRLHVKPYA